MQKAQCVLRLQVNTPFVSRVTEEKIDSQQDRAAKDLDAKLSSMNVIGWYWMIFESTPSVTFEVTGRTNTNLQTSLG